ncbi:16S rRNA (cytosine(1402)-N(4))-methyltransferase RsmH [Patescibacteria group bacterium]|nr:16S rRNA (cytosine(1402)-N(4))-methyltransferase RsmH [Patescibacteria group bacterium]
MHVPVLLKETVGILDPKKGEFFIDGTLGAGGHSEEILKRISPGGTLLGIDLDPEMLEKTKRRFEGLDLGSMKIFTEGNYADIPKVIQRHRLPKADGLILDLGFSSWHIESSGRGFSFALDEPLDMRYSPKINDLNAYSVVNGENEYELAKIIYEYGEERNSRRISKAIVTARRNKKIRTSRELSEIINSAFGGRQGKINNATKTFQAIRIYVNGELENLKTVLEETPEILKKGGRLGIITFHSLEDKIVKEKFKSLEKKGQAEILNKKVIKPEREEIIRNPKSRSAKLRAIKII